MQTMAIFYIHRVGFGHGPQAKSRRWFLEQALDKVALTAGCGPRRSTGWAYGGYPLNEHEVILRLPLLCSNVFQSILHEALPCS